MKPDESLVEIIIPHKSRWDLLSRLLDCLESQTLLATVCVVDNASDDETLKQLDDRRDVRVCAAETNLGFGRAVNLGVKTSIAEFIILLNNDMKPAPNFVEEMVRELQRRPRCAVAALQLRPDGLIDTVGVAVDQSLVAYDVGRGLDPANLPAETLRALGPSGGAAGFRRNEFLEIDGYDEEIFAYLEDVDLAIRLQAANISYALADHAYVWHFHSATLGQGSRRKNYLMGWSRGYLIWKYQRSLRLGARIRGALIDIIIYAGQALLDHNIGSMEGRVEATRALRYKRSDLDVEFISDNRLTIRESLRRRFRHGARAIAEPHNPLASSDSVSNSELRGSTL